MMMGGGLDNKGTSLGFAGTNCNDGVPQRMQAVYLPGWSIVPVVASSLALSISA